MATSLTNGILTLSSTTSSGADATIKNEDGKLTIMPINSVYIRFRGQSDPSGLFGGTWSDISSSFAGEFLRVNGGDSATFGNTQPEGLPNIEGSISKIAGKGVLLNMVSDEFSKSGALDCTWGSTTFARLDSYTRSVARGITFNAENSNPIYGASSHVTPYNSAIQVWKRVS